MPNTPDDVTLPPQTSTVLTLDGGVQFRLHNRTPGGIFVRLAAAEAGPDPGQYDLFIPPGELYVARADEYAGQMRAWSEGGGPVNVSIGRTLQGYVQSLFAEGQAGAIYAPSPSTCFQDVGGETPAGVGDPVARVLDISGNGNDLVQADGDAQPTLEQDEGGFYYLAFDGVDDYLRCTFAAPLAQPIDRISGLRQVVWTIDAQIYAGKDNADTGFVLLQAIQTPDIRSYAGASGPRVACTVGEARVITEHLEGASGRLAVQPGVSGTGNVGTLGAAGLTIGCSRIDDRFSNVDFYGLVTREALTDAQIGLCEQYIASLAGVTL